MPGLFVIYNLSLNLHVAPAGMSKPPFPLKVKVLNIVPVVIAELIVLFLSFYIF